MQTDRFIRRAVIVTSLALFPWLPVLLTHAADQPPGVGTPSQEIPKAITDAQEIVAEMFTPYGSLDRPKPIEGRKTLTLADFESMAS